MRSLATERLGADAERVSLITLAVTEAATNVVRHAYPDRAGMIDVEAEALDHHLRVRIADAGVGLGEPSENRGIGSGLRLIQSLAKTRVISHPGQGTMVEMVFSV